MEFLLKKLLTQGGQIISSNQCSEIEISEAKACDRMYVDGSGLGFIYLPEKMTGIKGKSGGFREGSGRPKKEETEVLSFRVPKKKAKKLKAVIQQIIDEHTK